MEKEVIRFGFSVQGEFITRLAREKFYNEGRLDYAVKRYMPYFESDYYFTNIDDCKQRMNMKNVSVISFGYLRF